MIVPFTHFEWSENLSSAGGKTYDIYQNRVSPDYFQTMRIPLFEGRDFRWSDTRSSGAKIILNEAAVRLLFPNQNPLGRLVHKQEDGKTVSYEVIGVVGNAKYEDLRSEAPPTGYVSMTQDDWTANEVVHGGFEGGRPCGSHCECGEGARDAGRSRNSSSGHDVDGRDGPGLPQC